MLKTNLLFTEKKFEKFVKCISDAYGKTESEIIKMFSLEFKIEKKDHFYTLLKNGKYVDSSKNLKKLQFKALTTEQINPDFTSYVLNKNLVSTKYRNIKTVNGYPFDIAKSALQKWIRRGKKEEAQKIACELDLFRFFSGGKSAWTNFYNRIRVIALEDVGLSFPNVFPILDSLLEKWKNEKENHFSKYLTQIITLLTTCPHSRTFSHIRANIKTEPEKKAPVFKYELKENENLRNWVDGLIWCLENRNIGAWFYIEKILKTEKLKSKISGNSRSGFLIFDILEKKFNCGECLKICKKWYKTLKVKEQFLTVMFPVYSYILRDNLQIFPIVLNDLCIDNYLKGGDLVFQDYVVDVHTAKGRKNGKTATDFALEGSIVAFEKLDILGEGLDSQFKKRYINSKINLEEIKKESEEFILKSRAQLVCSASRPDTYFAKDKTGRNVVVKGPFLTEQEARESFNVQSVLSLFEGVNTFDVNIKLLIPDMFEKSALGCRYHIFGGKPSFFVVMADLFDMETYPIEIKSSKLWPETEVVDYTKIFKEKDIGFGVPSEMSENALFSFLVQIAIRYIFKIGDFASRNFLRVGSKVYNLDTEGVEIGNTIRFSKAEKTILLHFLKNNRYRIENILNLWSENKIALQIVKAVFKIDISQRIAIIKSNPETMFL